MKKRDDNARLRAYVLELATHVDSDEPITPYQRWLIAAFLRGLAKQMPIKAKSSRGKLIPVDVGGEFALLRLRNVGVNQAYKQLSEKYDVEPEAIGKCIREQPAAKAAIAFVNSCRVRTKKKS
jgi:hypothetical protein